jgi:hypothetical protein
MSVQRWNCIPEIRLVTPGQVLRLCCARFAHAVNGAVGPGTTFSTEACDQRWASYYRTQLSVSTPSIQGKNRR